MGNIHLFGACRFIPVFLIGIGCATSIHGSAQAQAETFTIEEVVVTANKRVQNINDVGAAVTALSGEQMEKAGITSSTEVAQKTVGVTFAEGPLSHLPLSNIRGVSQNDFSGNLEPPNAVYVDQAYISFQGASAFQLFDVDRVEILKGPQGTLFGRNATGGLFHYLTREPTPVTEGYVRLRAGNLGVLSAEAAVSGAIADGLTGRLSATYSHTDPYLENRAGPDLMRFNDYAVRGQLAWAPTEAFSDRLIVSYGEQDHTHGFQHSATGFDPVSGLEFLLPANLNAYGNCAGCDPGGFRDGDGDPFAGAQDEPGLYDGKTLIATNLATWEIAPGTALTSVTNATHYEYFYQEDSDLSPRFGLLGQRTGDYRQFSQELRLNGESGVATWVAGLYFLDRKTDDTADQEFGLAWLDDVFGNLGFTPPGSLSPLGTTDELRSAFTMKTKSYAAFARSEFEVTPQITLIAGVRYSHDRLRYSFVSEEFIDGVPAAGAIGSTVFTEATAGDLTRNNKSEWSGQLGVNYRPTGDLLTYLTVNRSNKAGAWNAPFTGGSVTPLGQEILTSVEGGFKATLADGRAQLNASAFRYFYDDYQGFVFLNFATSLTNLKARVNGAEVELTLSPGGGWRAYFGAGYLDTKAYTSVPTGPTTTRSSRMPLAPRWSLNASLEKAWRFDTGLLTAGVDATYTTSVYSDVLNAPAGRIPSKHLAHAHLAFEPGDHWRLALIARNLGDDKKPVFRIPTHIGFTQDNYDRPTTIAVEAAYRF